MKGKKRKVDLNCEINTQVGGHHKHCSCRKGKGKKHRHCWHEGHLEWQRDIWEELSEAHEERLEQVGPIEDGEPRTICCRCGKEKGGVK